MQIHLAAVFPQPLSAIEREERFDLAHPTVLCHGLLMSRGGIRREPLRNLVRFDLRIASVDCKYFGSKFGIA